MGSCASSPHPEQRPLATEVAKSDAPPKRPPVVQRKLGCTRYLSNAWTFDTFDLDLEGGDWRYAFATTRAFPGPTALFIVRALLVVLMAVYFWLTLTAYPISGLKYWCIHLSSWVDTFVLLYLLGSFLVHLRALLLAGTPEPRAPAFTPWYVSLLWVLYAIALPLSIVSFAFQYVPSYGGLGLTALPGDKREAPAALMLLSLLLNNYSYHVTHTVWPMLFALGYILFTYVYYRKGGLDEEGAPFVFAGLDWAEPDGPALNGGAVLVGCTLLNFVCWFCSALVRSVSDSDAWRRIEAAHAMTIMPGLSGSQQP